MEKSLTPHEISIFTLIIVTILALLFLPSPVTIVVSHYDAARANTCRILHTIAYTKTRRLIAVEACTHNDPDKWLSQYNLAVCAMAKEEK